MSVIVGGTDRSALRRRWKIADDNRRMIKRTAPRPRQQSSSTDVTAWWCRSAQENLRRSFDRPSISAAAVGVPDGSAGRDTERELHGPGHEWTRHGRCGERVLAASAECSVTATGCKMSQTIMSKASFSASRSPSLPVLTPTTSWPSSRKPRQSASRSRFSSSMKRIRTVAFPQTGRMIGLHTGQANANESPRLPDRVLATHMEAVGRRPIVQLAAGKDAGLVRGDGSGSFGYPGSRRQSRRGRCCSAAKSTARTLGTQTTDERCSRPRTTAEATSSAWTAKGAGARPAVIFV
jgi:hypothetical protein